MKELLMVKFAAAALAASVIGTTVLPAGASPQPAAKPDLTRIYPGESYTQYRRYYGGRYYGGGRYYWGSPYYRRNYYGGAAAAGVAGLAAGALIAGSLANQAQAAPPPPPATVDPQLAAYCARRFRSFDPYSGTYLASSGERIVCTY
jgi:BA14K-like protein